MTIFDYLTQIFVKKQSDVSLDTYVPYMINRWISFINPTICDTINYFNNKSLLENKQMHYRMMVSAFPKLNAVPRIFYEKKKTSDQDTPETNLDKATAQVLELSEREIKELRRALDELN